MLVQLGIDGHRQHFLRLDQLGHREADLLSWTAIAHHRLQHSHQLGHDAEHEVPTTAFVIFPGSSDHALGQQHVNHKIPLDEIPKFAALQTECYPP